MKILKWTIAVVIAIPVLLIGVIYGASEFGGEVAVLERVDTSGGTKRVRLWIVDEIGSSLIEHGDADAYWIAQLQNYDQLTIERDGEAINYRGSADPSAHATYHKLRREKYGWADQTLEALGGKAAECTAVPVRLKLL